MGTVSAASVAAREGSGERVDELPERVRDALGELAGAAKEGLLALSVGVGLGVLHELLEGRGRRVRPEGQAHPGPRGVGHGHEDGEVPLGGRQGPVSRPDAVNDGGPAITGPPVRHR